MLYKTYSLFPFLPWNYPSRFAGYYGSGCPHTSGVRLGPRGSFATKPCRPTACTERTTPPPSPLTANSKLLTPNWLYTFSAKERDTETGLSYFGSRYYSSDLSIWLSVDPMSDKYASLSPYVYCADNPVKLVDPNGKEWETPEDANYAQHLISIAQTRQKQYDPSSREYKLLQEGIDGLISMGKEKGQKYTFNKSLLATGNVSRQESGTISINYIEDNSNEYLKDGSAWHEAFHLSRRNAWKTQSCNERRNAATQYWGFDENGFLFSDNNCDEEYMAYRSQMAFSPQSMPHLPLGQVDNNESIQLYVASKYKKECCDHKFRLPSIK